MITTRITFGKYALFVRHPISSASGRNSRTFRAMTQCLPTIGFGCAWGSKLKGMLHVNHISIFDWPSRCDFRANFFKIYQPSSTCLISLKKWLLPNLAFFDVAALASSSNKTAAMRTAVWILFQTMRITTNGEAHDS